ncbi:hypothetical protein AC579_2381 [Pseudocercospora musae]|uniref:Tyrosinase copper-binding domain-containing protein n=1 Tax=Pseudocercospora musae TaxID=113226 RepID=A0A139IGX0_9PEZI|nr:hypothetical protein AC579_2381 [Pseudocercospora musae]
MLSMLPYGRHLVTMLRQPTAAYRSWARQHAIASQICAPCDRIATQPRVENSTQQSDPMSPSQMSKLFANSGDLGFSLLHAQIDRLWTMWQEKNRENRTLNYPSTPNVTLEDWMSFGRMSEVGQDRRVRELGSQVWRSEWPGYDSAIHAAS